MRSMVPERHRNSLRKSVEPLATLSPLWVVLLPFFPVLFVVLVYTGAYTVTMGTDPGFPAQFANIPLGIGYLVALLFLFRRSTADIWTASVPVRSPSTREIGMGGILAGVGIAILIGVNDLSRLLQVPTHGPGDVETAVGAGALLFASVIAAPVVEEILFRGLLFGYLLGRGHGLWTAGLLSVLAFGVYHLFIAGVTSVVVGVSLGALLTALRIRYDNLVGAWLMHALVNLWAFLVALSVTPAPW